MKVIITEVTKLTNGKSTKNGKTHDWVLSKVKIDGDDREFTTFEDFNGRESQEIEVEIKEEEYQGKQQWKIYLPKRNVYAELNQLRADVDRLMKVGNMSDLPPEVAPKEPILPTAEDEASVEDVFGE